MAVSETVHSIGIGGVIWLIVLFVGILFWAFRPRIRRRFRDDDRRS